MAKQKLNHSRDMSTSYKRDNYYYDIERSKATAKQVKFYRRLWYLFKENNLNLKTEAEKRNICPSTLTNPSGRAEFSEAISNMMSILEDYGLYKTNEKSKKFIPTYNAQTDGCGGIKRVWQSIQVKKEVTQ